MKQKILHLRKSILIFLTHQMVLPMLKFFRKTKAFPHSEADLRAMPKGSLGHELIAMLDNNEFELLTYYARHDMKHIVLGYDTTEKGEVCLQSFMLGNGRFSFPVAATVLYGLLTMPEYWLAMRHAYRQGKQHPSIHQWDWYGLLPEQVTTLRQQMNFNIQYA
jgi:ubiquinone biosynthesis protein Coq4